VGAARKKYTPEYKAQAVELVIGSGKPVAEIARDLGIHEATLGNWVNLAKKNGTIVEKPVTADERARLRELEDEVRKLRMERDFLKKQRRGLPARASEVRVRLLYRRGAG
jgi:transposase-like protein